MKRFLSLMFAFNTQKVVRRARANSHESMHGLRIGVLLLLLSFTLTSLVACGSGSSGNTTAAQTQSGADQSTNATSSSESSADSNDSGSNSDVDGADSNDGGLDSDDNGDQNLSPADGANLAPLVLLYHRSGSSVNEIDETNPIWQKIHQIALDEANVDLQLELYDWGDNFNQRLTMHAAAGDLPPGVYSLGNNAFVIDIINQMGAAGFLHDWSPYIYDTANYPTLLENAGETFVKMMTNADGSIYGFPAETHAAYPHAPGGVSYRYDWLLEIGGEFPANEQELYDTIIAFRDNFTDDSGNPITPVSFAQWNNFTFWLNSWLGTSLWFEENGEWSIGKYTKIDQLNAALLFLNRLWNEGLMDKESFIHNNEQVITKGSNSQFGITSFDYSTTYSINDSFWATDPDSDKFIANGPPLSCYPGLDVNDVNSVEILSSPFNRIIATKDGISDEDFVRIVKVLDWIGEYDTSLFMLMGFEGEDWIYDEVNDRKIRSENWNAKVTANINYQYNAGLCYFSSLNSHRLAMYDLLNCIAVRPSDIFSVNNIKGHQIAVTNGMNVVAAGEIESARMQLIEDAWKQMVVAAISAPDADSCTGQVDGWLATLDGLGYQDIVLERMAICESYGLFD